jgi:hypothetical protein
MNSYLKNILLFIPRVAWFIPSFIFQNTVGRLIGMAIAPAAKLAKPSKDEHAKKTYDALFKNFESNEQTKPVVIYIPGNAANIIELYKPFSKFTENDFITIANNNTEEGKKYSTEESCNNIEWVNAIVKYLTEKNPNLAKKINKNGSYYFDINQFNKTKKDLGDNLGKQFELYYVPYKYNPKNIDDLVNQYIEKVEYIRTNYPNKPIIINGLSLGGAVATKVVAHFHNKAKKEKKSPPNIKLFNDQSFSSITNVVTEGFMPKLLGLILYPIIKILLKLCNWELNATKYYNQIPEQYKTYLTLKYKDENTSEKQYDNVLGKGSLHRKVQSKNKDKSNKHKFIVNRTDESTCHEFTSHGSSLTALKNRDGKTTGLTFFKEFALAPTEGHDSRCLSV